MIPFDIPPPSPLTPLTPPPRNLEEELATTRELLDVNELLENFPSHHIDNFLDAPLSLLTPDTYSPVPTSLALSTLVNNITMADNRLSQRMPPRNNSTAPKWDESRPRELNQYFRELEYLLADCSIDDENQKKEYATRYLSYDTAETWLGLPEFNDHTYAEWKAAVLRLYPRAEESARYTLQDLERLVNQTFSTGITTLGHFSDYYRDFQCLA